jgi:hypothetical protein
MSQGNISVLTLAVFMLATLIEVDGMIVDLLLRLSERQTITDFVRQHWWAGIPIVSLHLIGVAALCIHFWGSGTIPEMGGKVH